MRTLAFALATVFALAACNTMAGLEKIQDKARK